MITWSGLYSVGVEEIDDQHKRFFALIGELFQANDSGVDTETLPPYLLKELAAYAEYHFATEEKYFDLYHYEHAEEHKSEHRMFKERVAELTTHHESGGADTIALLAEFMGDWLANHIAQSDKKYMQCFKEHGLS